MTPPPVHKLIHRLVVAALRRPDVTRCCWQVAADVPAVRVEIERDGGGIVLRFTSAAQLHRVGAEQIVADWLGPMPTNYLP